MQSDQNLHWLHFGQQRMQNYFMLVMKTLITDKICKLIWVFLGRTCVFSHCGSYGIDYVTDENKACVQNLLFFFSDHWHWLYHHISTVSSENMLPGYMQAVKALMILHSHALYSWPLVSTYCCRMYLYSEGPYQTVRICWLMKTFILCICPKDTVTLVMLNKLRCHTHF